jgi:paired amphipathic helix protein Sin3a
VRDEMNRLWRKVFEQNYNKSLDHRSFYFKQVG